MTLGWSLKTVLLLLGLTAVQASVFSGRENICNLEECRCSQETRSVTCSCSEHSSFQESFSFYTGSRHLPHLTVSDCPKLVLLADAITSESPLSTFQILNVRHVEVHTEAVSVASLTSLAINRSESLVLHQNSLKSSIAESQSLTVRILNIQSAVIKQKALAGLKSFTAENIADLVLETNSFKLKVPTEEPTINLEFLNISSSLSPYVFPSSFKSITIRKSKIDAVNAKAFSGLYINNIVFEDVSINRIEKLAFSDNTIISSLRLTGCNISSLSQKSVVAGISRFVLNNSVIQSISKHGAINATVATVEITNNRFRTLGEESFQLVSWDSVVITNNTFDFLEQGALNAIKAPSQDSPSYFSFRDNFISRANVKSLLTQIPSHVKALVGGNVFGQTCDCKAGSYVRSITGYSRLSSPFLSLTSLLTNTSSCRLASKDRACFPGQTSSQIGNFLSELCVQGSPQPACRHQPGPDTLGKSFYDDFLLLFQVKTTKGILLFLLFCVLCLVITVAICVGFIWVHRLCKRAKLVRDNLSGSFQFNSGEDKQQILYGSDQTTCHSLQDEEPAYAEIAEVHPPPKHLDNGTLPNGFPTLPIFESTTLVTNVGSTLPSLHSRTLPPTVGNKSDTDGDTNNQTESTSLLSDSNLETTQISRLSMSETSLTDEIMMALRDKLNDPNLYMAVADAKLSPTYETAVRKEDDLYCSPLYSDPLQIVSVPERTGGARPHQL